MKPHHHYRDESYYEALRDILKGILCGCSKVIKPLAVVRLAFGAFAVTFTGDFHMFLPDDKSVTATLSYVDAKGNPALVEGAPVWSTDRPDLVTVTAAADGMSAVIAPVGPLGSAQISVDADADLGAGVTTLTTLGSVEVIAGTAVAGVMNFGEPA